MKLLFVPIAVLSVLLASLAVACGGGSKANTSSLATEAAGQSPQTALTVEAKSLKFNTKTIVVPADTSVTITFDNEDGGTLHNMAFYPDKEAKDAFFKGDLISGKATKEYTFTTPDAGVYYFRCDAHPDMNGAFIVK
jgi:plastocyanin